MGIKTSPKRLTRPKQGRVFGGVCLALANYFTVDVVLMRLVWLFLVMPGGLPGILPYLILWLVIPEE